MNDTFSRRHSSRARDGWVRAWRVNQKCCCVRIRSRAAVRIRSADRVRSEVLMGVLVCRDQLR
jgi:hypothetical protein